MTFTCNIPGTPQQQGSKRNVGHHSIEANRNLAPWRADAIWRLQQAMTDQLVQQYTGPVEVAADFYYTRPASHYGTGKNALTLKASAPTYKPSAPDLDKLQRALGDALTQAGVIRDDALIVRWTTTKQWHDTGLVSLTVHTADHTRKTSSE